MSTTAKLLIFPVIIAGVYSTTLSAQATTAKQNLSAVDAAAKGLASDAVLISVYSITDVFVSGSSNIWAYVFKSNSQSRVFEVVFQEGTIVTREEPSIQDDFVNTSLHPLSDDWVDSNEALSKANQAGGSSFIGGNPEYLIEARLYSHGEASDELGQSYFIAPFWEIRYEVSGERMEILVHAYTAKIRRAYPIHYYLDSVDEASTIWASDAQLIAIASEEMRPNGSSADWRLSYLSEYRGEICEYWLHGYRLMQQPALSRDDHPFGRSAPLPSSWITSQEALSEAERNGGTIFRQSGGETRISAQLLSELVFIDTDDFHLPIPNLPVWRVQYQRSTGQAQKRVGETSLLGTLSYSPPSDLTPGRTSIRRIDGTTASSNVDDLEFVIDAVSGMMVEDLLDTLTPTTARTHLAKVDSVASEWSADAELVYLSAAVVDTTGVSVNWYYVYRSENASSLRGYSLLGRDTPTIDQTSRPDNPFGRPDAPPLPENWIDSDSVYAVAEREIGQAFRRTHGGRYGDVNLGTLQQELPIARASWRVFYGSPTGDAGAVIDAEFGFDYTNPPRYTARERLEHVFDIALQDDPTHELAEITAGRVTEEGKARRWTYRFKPADRDTLNQYWNYGGIIFHDAEAYPEIQPDVTPLPTSWIDSDSALVLADQQGGSQFKDLHPDWRIGMAVHAFSEPPGKTSSPAGVRAMWNAYYEAPGGAFQHFTIEAGYETLFVTAGEMMDAVNGEAAALSADIELISIISCDLTVEGKQDAWHYVFQSREQERLYQIDVVDGVITIADEVTVDDLSVYLGAPPLTTDWSDSDLAVEAAEERGGAAFRMAYPEYEIAARLFVLPDDAAKWEISYSGPDTVQVHILDALTLVGREIDSADIPLVFSLGQNFPNPFFETTSFRYTLPVSSHVTIEVYCITGQKIGTIIDAHRNAGVHTTSWQAGDLSPGVYYYRMRVEGPNPSSQVRKMLLVK